MFEQENALDRFEAFASEHGPRFYGLPLNSGTLTLERVSAEPPPLPVPPLLELANGSERPTQLVPFHAGETLPWRLQT